MRISGRSVAIALCGTAAVFLFSCKTPPAEKPAQPAAPAEKPQKQEPKSEPKKFDRIAFGESLEKLLADGKFDAALALFDSIREPDASDVSIRTLKLSVLISAGKTDEAAALANELESKFPDNADILYIQATLAGVRNDRTTRIKYLNRMLQINPRNGEAMTAVGLDLYSKKEYTQAKDWLVKAIATDASNTDALLGLARVYYMQADLEKAESTLNLAIDKTPAYSVLWAERARVKSETNDLAGAIADSKKALELDPKVYGHWIDYGNYLISSGDRKEARRAFSEAIKISPDNHLAYIYRAGINDDLGNTDEAIADYTKVCVLLPQYYFAAESLGILEWGKGNYEASCAAFQQALGWAPKNESYALMATLCLYRMNKPEEAKKFMAKYITTLDRSTTEYFLCRLFVDKAGDADVLNRISKEKKLNDKNRMLFYAAEYYDLFQNKSIAMKFYVEVTTVPAPGFFEYRLSQWALKDLDAAGTAGTQPAATQRPVAAGTKG
jgi:tetratricopeptide (TPR) repeat protein